MVISKAAVSRLKNVSIYSLSALLVVASVVVAVRPQGASAAALTQTLVRFDRLATSTASTGTVCAKPATVATEASVQVTFPTGYTVSTTLGNWTVDTTNLAWPATAAAWPGVNTATAAAGQVVTFPSTDLTLGNLYCFNWTNTAAVTTKATATSSNAGTVTTRDSVPTAIDTGSYSTATISGDQISVTATVPQSFSFALSGNSDALGTLSTSSVTTSGSPVVASVNTNSAAGWVVWARDANSGVRSTAANYTIPSATSTLTAGTEGHNLGLTSTQGGGTGTISLPAAFDGSVQYHGGGLTTALQQVASSNGTATNAQLTLKNNVAISSTTAAATDYADTITVVGAGLF